MTFVLCCVGLGVPLSKDETLWGSSFVGDGELGEGFPTCGAEPPAERVLVSLANTLQLEAMRVS